MEFKSSVEIGALLNWWLVWVHRILAAIQDSFGSLKMPDSNSGFGMVVLIGLPIGLLIEALNQKNRSGSAGLLASYRVNLTIFICNNLLLSSLSLTALYVIAERFSASQAVPGFTMSLSKWLVALIVIDFFLYLWHLASHHIPLLWMFHKVHHSDTHMNVTTALRFHAGELILTTVFKALLIALLSVPVEVVLTTEAVIACFTLVHHMNLNFGGERFLKWVFIVPCLHRVHHSARRAEHDHNFGSVFSVWDRVFGTFRETVPEFIGLPGIPEQNAWQTFVYGLSRPGPARSGCGCFGNPERRVQDRTVERPVPRLTEGRPFGYLNQASPGIEPDGRTSETEGSSEGATGTIRNLYHENNFNWKNVIEFGLANAMLLNEITECAWRLNFVYVMACARVSTFDSTDRPRKPDARFGGKKRAVGARLRV